MDYGKAMPLKMVRGGKSTGDRMGYVFVAFFAVPFFLFNVLPIIFGAYVSLTDWSIFGDPNFLGLENYQEAFADEEVSLAFYNTITYALIIVPSIVVTAYAAALFVNQRWPLSSLARTMFFAPNVVSATVIGLIWVWILESDFGLMNYYLGRLGMASIPWLTDVDWSIYGVSLASLWWDLGLAFVLFLAALQDVPQNLYEAAAMDGAPRWRQIVYITIPYTKPTISMVITLQLIATLRIFSQVYLMTNGGPAGSSMSVIYYVYVAAVNNQLMGYASTVCVLLFAMILVFTLIQQRLIREK